MQKNMHGKRIATLILLVTMLLSVFAFSAFASFDLSHAGSDANKTLTAADIIEQYLGEKITAGEREFLDRYASLKVTYNSIVTTDRVRCVFDGEGVTLEADQYSYKSATGTVFSLAPVKAIVGEKEYKLTDGKARIDTDAPDTVTVIYEGEVELSAEQISEALTLYYDTASYVYGKDGYSEAYNSYLSYVVKKRIYDEALAKYNAYIEAYELYLTQKADYESYDERLAQYKIDLEAYLAYNADMQRLEAQIQKYEAYSAKISTVKSQLKNFEYINHKVGGRSIYSAVMGGAVDQVLENEDAIVNFFGVPKLVVELASVATDKVREYMTSYNALETESEKYAYYIANYDGITKYFHLLTKTLDELYKNSGVVTLMKTMEKEEKYVLLVSQLAHISNLMMDGDVKSYDGKSCFDSSWTIGGRSMKTVLTDANMLVDTDTGTPLSDGYPTSVAKPDIPAEVKEPTMPTKPTLPAEPTAVADPGAAPSEVNEPEIPVPATQTVEELDRTVSAEDREKLKSAFAASDCVKRDRQNESYTLKISTEVVKNKDSQKFEVKFVNDSGAMLYKTSVEEGSAVVYEGIIPYKPTDTDGSYTFAGWYEFREDNDYSASEKISLASAVTKDLVLVPAFDRLPTYYTVKWTVDGNVITKTYISGEVPECPIAPSKSDRGDFGYRFTGWNKPVGVLHSDDEYVAVFEEYYIVPVGSLGASVKDDGSIVSVSSVGVYGAEFDISAILSRIAGKRALKINTASGSVEFSFADVIRLNELGAKYFSFTSVHNPKTGKHKFFLTLKDSSGNLLTEDFEPTVVSPVSLQNSDGYTVSYETGDGTVVRVSYRYADGSVSFAAIPNLTYVFSAEYSVICVSDPDVEVSISATSALPGTKVYVSYSLKDGYELSSFSLSDSSGNAVIIDEDGSFIMPASDVLLALHSVQKIYTVRFSSNGTVLASYEHVWGDVPVPPKDPVRAADEEYSYTFEGWDSEILPVSGDITYEAVYSREPIVKENSGGIKLSPTVKKLFIAGVIGLSVLLLAAIALITVALIRRKKRLDHIKNSRKNSDRSNKME